MLWAVVTKQNKQTHDANTEIAHQRYDRLRGIPNTKNHCDLQAQNLLKVTETEQ